MDFLGDAAGCVPLIHLKLIGGSPGASSTERRRTIPPRASIKPPEISAAIPSNERSFISGILHHAAADQKPNEPEIAMTFTNIAGYCAVATLSYALGGLPSSREPATSSVAASTVASRGIDAPRPVSPRPDAAASLASPAMGALPSSPFIAVAADGNVTLRVEQQPLEWVLQEISRQSGWNDVEQRAGISAGRTPAECARASRASAEYVGLLRRAMEHGSAADRRGLLLRARADGAALPDALLKSMFETDSSDPVRLDAFDLYLERRTGDVATLRRALEAALYVPNDAIREMAKQRLQELSGG